MKQNIAYEGVVKLHLKYHNKTVKTLNFHNEGRDHLFQFLAHCLAGNYTQVSSLVPYKIATYSAGQEGESVPSSWTDIGAIISNPTNRTSTYAAPRKATTSVVPFTDDDGTEGWQTTLEFILPFSAISSDKDTNLFVLYPNNSGLEANEVLAYFILRSENNPDNLGKIPVQDENYNLFIEWTLRIYNQPIN